MYTLHCSIASLYNTLLYIMACLSFIFHAGGKINYRLHIPKGGGYMKIKDIYKMYLLAKLQNVKVYVKTIKGIKAKIIKCKVMNNYGIYDFNMIYSTFHIL